MNAELDERRKRLRRVHAIMDKEAYHLKAVTARFFASADRVDAAWLEKKLSTARGIDELESFGGKFARFQASLSDKLLPAFLSVAGEKRGTVVENVNLAERLGLIQDAQTWLGARGLRNRLVHEYVEDLSELASSLNTARRISDSLLDAYQAFRRYSARKLDVALQE